MPGSTGHRVWMGALVSLTLGLALTWGLLQFGAVESSVLYRLFLFLLVPSCVALATPPWRNKVDLRAVALVIVGLFVLGQVALQPTLEARGYLHLSIGWIALWLSLWLAVRSLGLRRFLLLVLVLLGALEAIYGLIQSVGGYDYIGDYFRNRGRLATGTLINRNHFAALLNMLLPLALGMFFADRALKRSERVKRTESLAKTWIVLLGCSAMGVAVLLSQSRGGTLSLLMTLLFMAMLLSLSRKKRSRRGLSGAATGVLLFLVFGMGAAFGLEALVERFGQMNEDLSRVEVYRDTLDMMADSPVVGVGPGMYEWRFRLFQTTQPGALYDHAHNDYLESAVEWGIPLALLAWAFVFWRFYRSSELALSARDPRDQGLALGTAGALFSILVHSLVDFSLQIPAVLMVFGCILGLSWSLDFAGGVGFSGRSSTGSTGLKRPDSMPAVPAGSSLGGTADVINIALRLLLLIALLSAGYQTLQRARADISAQPEHGVAGLERAVDLDPRSPEPQYLLAMAYRDLPGVGNLTTATQRFQRAVRFNPYAWRYWLELSRAQELEGDLDQAEASLLVAVNLNPGSGQYRWRLANLLLRRGNLDEAVEEMATAVELEPQLADSAVALLLKSGVEADRIEGLLPDGRTDLLRLMRTLLVLSGRPVPVSSSAVETGYESLLARLWSRLLADPEPMTVDEGRSYAVHLFRAGHPSEARQAWLELTRANGIVDAAFEEGENRVWNGNFELAILNAPLGWRIGRSEGFGADRIPTVGRSDSPALVIEFHGTENLDFSQVSQELILEPEMTYRFGITMRAEKLTTDQGVFVEVISRDPSGILVATEPLLGSTDWTTLEAEFVMPEGEGRALIRLRRRPSQRIDNRLRGKVYVDSVRIEQVSP